MSNNNQFALDHTNNGQRKGSDVLTMKGITAIFQQKVPPTLVHVSFLLFLFDCNHPHFTGIIFQDQKKPKALSNIR